MFIMTVMNPDPALALAFLNTTSPPGGGPDLWTAPQDVRAWLSDEGLAAHPEALAGLTLPDLRVLFDDAVRLRHALTELVEGWTAQSATPSAMALMELNRRLGRQPRRGLELASGSGGYEIRQHVARASVSELLAPIAEAGALLLAQGEPTRVRRCAAPGCPRWFLDTSKNQQRRWCAMAVCGNRAKVSAHHLRSRRASQ